MSKRIRIRSEAGSTAGAIFGFCAATCLAVLMIAGTIKIITIWF